jgi:Fe-S cluster assembly protein SufD
MPAPAKLQAADARLSSLPAPVSSGWTAVARAQALARLRAMGLPARRDEYWRYTDPALLSAPDAEVAPQEAAASFPSIEAVRLTFVDGVFAPDLSDDPARAGVEVDLLGSVQDRDLHWARETFGALEARGQSPVERPFAALATAFAPEGVLIRAKSPAALPVHLVYLASSASSDPIFHNVVRVDPGASLTLLESGTPGARVTSVTEIDVAEGGAFHHVRDQGRMPGRLAATHLFARIGAGATFKSFTMASGGRLSRNEAVLTLAGDAAVAHVAGVALGAGGSHLDDTVFITHGAVACESRQVFKKVLREGGTGVFQGKILVERGAQKTDGYQISQALLLDDDAVFLAKPELEIYADDVKCSHGSTSGAIDETALYYLRSRGIPRAEAEDLLVESFLAEAIAEIDSPGIAADVLARLQDWLKQDR